MKKKFTVDFVEDYFLDKEDKNRPWLGADKPAAEDPTIREKISIFDSMLNKKKKEQEEIFQIKKIPQKTKNRKIKTACLMESPKLLGIAGAMSGESHAASQVIGGRSQVLEVGGGSQNQLHVAPSGLEIQVIRL